MRWGSPLHGIENVSPSTRRHAAVRSRAKAAVAPGTNGKLGPFVLTLARPQAHGELTSQINGEADMPFLSSSECDSRPRSQRSIPRVGRQRSRGRMASSPSPRSGTGTKNCPTTSSTSSPSRASSRPTASGHWPASRRPSRASRWCAARGLGTGELDLHVDWPTKAAPELRREVAQSQSPASRR